MDRRHAAAPTRPHERVVPRRSSGNGERATCGLRWIVARVRGVGAASAGCCVMLLARRRRSPQTTGKSAHAHSGKPTRKAPCPDSLRGVFKPVFPLKMDKWEGFLNTQKVQRFSRCTCWQRSVCLMPVATQVEITSFLASRGARREEGTATRAQKKPKHTKIGVQGEKRKTKVL